MESGAAIAAWALFVKLTTVMDVPKTGRSRGTSNFFASATLVGQFDFDLFLLGIESLNAELADLAGADLLFG